MGAAVLVRLCLGCSVLRCGCDFPALVVGSHLTGFSSFPLQYAVETPGVTIMRQTNRFFFCGHTSGKVNRFRVCPHHGPCSTRCWGLLSLWVRGEGSEGLSHGLLPTVLRLSRLLVFSTARCLGGRGVNEFFGSSLPTLGFSFCLSFL